MNDSKDTPNKSEEKRESTLKKVLTKPLFKADSKIAQYSGLGVSLVVTILIFLWVGMWLDGKFETGFLFTLSLTFIGFAAGFYSFYLTDADKKENPNYNKF